MPTTTSVTWPTWSTSAGARSDSIAWRWAGRRSVEHFREAAVEAALTQDADVVVIRHLLEQASFSGIGALLRF